MADSLPLVEEAERLLNAATEDDWHRQEDGRIIDGDGFLIVEEIEAGDEAGEFIAAAPRLVRELLARLRERETLLYRLAEKWRVEGPYDIPLVERDCWGREIPAKAPFACGFVTAQRRCADQLTALLPSAPLDRQEPTK